MSRPIGSRSGKVTMGEMELALRSAYETAITFGSDLTLPGSVRAPWLDQAHELGDVLARIAPDEPIGPRCVDMSPFPDSMVLQTPPRTAAPVVANPAPQPAPAPLPVFPPFRGSR